LSELIIAFLAFGIFHWIEHDFHYKTLLLIRDQEYAPSSLLSLILFLKRNSVVMAELRSEHWYLHVKTWTRHPKTCQVSFSHGLQWFDALMIPEVPGKTASYRCLH
jgi:hypothetical protein